MESSSHCGKARRSLNGLIGPDECEYQNCDHILKYFRLFSIKKMDELVKEHKNNEDSMFDNVTAKLVLS